MLRRSALLLLLLAGCSKGPEADLQYIKQARSIGAEWALVNEQANKGQVTETYVASMHQWLRQNLETTAKSLTQPDSRYALELRALLAQPDDAAPDQLRAHVEALKQIEDSLESA
jgi:Tfp pilus assembly protein PilP